MTKPRKDLTGQRFGKLVVLEYTGFDKERGTQWKCQCDCGNIKIVNITRDKPKSCGCSRKSRRYEHGCQSHADLAGQKFGKWTVLYEVDRKDHETGSRWLCRCECGREQDISGWRLRAGKSVACRSCFFKEHPRKNKLIIPDKNYIIEFDGPQHFKAVGWGSKSQIKATFERTVKNDKIKNNYCAQHNIPLIRIPYTHANDIVLDDLLIEKSKYIYRNGGAKCSS